jgi:hypothetical protein
LLDQHGLCRIEGALPAVDPAWAVIGSRER